MFTHGEHVDVANYHHLIMIFVEDGVVQHVLQPHMHAHTHAKSSPFHDYTDYSDVVHFFQTQSNTSTYGSNPIRLFTIYIQSNP